MLSINKILVPIDFSASSQEAMRFAAELAKRFDASVTVMHVYQVPGYVLPEGFLVAGPQTVTELTNSMQSALDTARRDLVAMGLAKVDSVLAQGTSHSEILRTAEAGGYDLIVMGTHGRTGLSHALLGSVAERVVRKATCPVLTIHAKPHEERAETANVP